MTPHTDLIFYQVAATSPIIWSDQAHDYVRIDGVWRLPRSGDAPEFYTPIDAWPDSHAGQLARLNKELAHHIAENALRDETILKQARELASAHKTLDELAAQLAALQERQEQQQQQQPAEAWRCATEGCAHTERSLILPDYCFTCAAKLASTKPAPAAKAAPEPKKARMVSKPKLTDERPDLPCPHGCGKLEMKTEHAIRVHVGHKHSGLQLPIEPVDYPADDPGSTQPAELVTDVPESPAELAKRRRAHSGPPEPIPVSTYEPPPDSRTFVCAQCGSTAFAASVSDARICVRCVKKAPPAEPTAIAAAA